MEDCPVRGEDVTELFVVGIGAAMVKTARTSRRLIGRSILNFGDDGSREVLVELKEERYASGRVRVLTERAKPSSTDPGIHPGEVSQMAGVVSFHLIVSIQTNPAGDRAGKMKAEGE